VLASMKPVKNILVTMGDPAGISGEIIMSALAALAQPKGTLAKQIRAHMAARPVNLYVVGDRNVLARAARIVHKKIPVDIVEAFSPSQKAPTRIQLFERSHIANFRFGVLSYGREQLDYLDFAIAKARGGDIAAIVTAPMTKEAVAKVLPGFVGHTGYLAE